jgi:DNA-binding NarL/FixJ family response regulator
LGGEVISNRIVVAGGHEMVVEALVDLLAEESGLCLVGVARNALEAVALAEVHAPEVLLVDTDAVDISVAQFAQAVRLAAPATRMVALSGHEDAASVRRLLDAGFDRHVSKGSGLADLLVNLLEDHVCFAH